MLRRVLRATARIRGPAMVVHPRQDSSRQADLRAVQQRHMEGLKRLKLMHLLQEVPEAWEEERDLLVVVLLVTLLEEEEDILVEVLSQVFLPATQLQSLEQAFWRRQRCRRLLLLIHLVAQQMVTDVSCCCGPVDLVPVHRKILWWTW